MTDNVIAKIPFGERNGRMLEVSEVPSGLACECLCPTCKGRLQAKKRNEKTITTRNFTDHFSHDPSENTEECRFAFETSVHRMSKQIIAEEGVLNLPSYTITVTMSDSTEVIHSNSELVYKHQYASITKIKSEQSISDIRPDIVGELENQPIFIEIAVTHFVDKDKRSKIRAMGVNAIEIDLSGVGYGITKDKLRKKITSEIKNKKWLSFSTAHTIKEKLRDQLKKKILKVNLEYTNIQSSRNLEAEREFQVREWKRTFVPPPPVRTESTKPINQHRWFVCESCYKLFESIHNIDVINQSSITCPNCEQQVSTKMTRSY